MIFQFAGIILASWLVADFLSGVVHWLEDRYARVEWPIIGKYVAAPNEMHHADPMAFTLSGYWYRNSTTIIPTAAIIAVIVACGLWLNPVLDSVEFWAMCESGMAMIGLHPKEPAK